MFCGEKVAHFLPSFLDSCLRREQCKGVDDYVAFHTNNHADSEDKPEKFGHKKAA